MQRSNQFQSQLNPIGLEVSLFPQSTTLPFSVMENIPILNRMFANITDRSYILLEQSYGVLVYFDLYSSSVKVFTYPRHKELSPEYKHYLCSIGKSLPGDFDLPTLPDEIKNLDISESRYLLFLQAVTGYSEPYYAIERPASTIRSQYAGTGIFTKEHALYIYENFGDRVHPEI